jgi:hypothetical protein
MYEHLLCTLLCPPFLAVSLAHPNPLTCSPFSLTGEITTTSLLDRETKSEYILIVRAVDGGVGHNQKTGIATVSAHPSCAPGAPADQVTVLSSSSDFPVRPLGTVS